jgi:hypothetical protein
MRNAAAVRLALAIVLFSGCQQGHRPDVAAVPTGPSSGAVGVEYTFSSSAEDRDGDDVAIRFDWGDGDTSDWSPWVRPGDTVAMSHSCAASGSFNVKAQARARNITISGWSDAHAFVIASSWVRIFGGPGGDSACSVQQTLDGGYVLTGCTDTPNEHPHLLLAKIDAAGTVVWTQTFGDGAMGWGRSVLQVHDGGYLVVGCKWLHSGDVWLIKTDVDGNMVWEKTYSGSYGDEACSAEQTRDGGYVVTGFFSTSGGSTLVWLLKTDANGDLEWERTFGHGWCEGRSVQQTRDGGYIAAALPDEDSVGAVWLIKTDADGNATWTRTFGDVPVYYAGMSVLQTDDGGYVACGTSRDGEHGGNDALLVRTDLTGEVLWTKSFGGERVDWANSVVKTPDGGFIVVGNTSSYSTSGDHDVWLIKTDAGGDTLWTRTYGWSDNDMGYSVQLTSDGGYIIAGKTWKHGLRSQVLLIKTDAEGSVDEGQGNDEARSANDQ